MKHIIFALLVVLLVFAWYQTTPPQNESEIIAVEVEPGDRYYTISEKLKEAGLIRSELAFKAYLYFNNPETLQAGFYMLDKSWSINRIIEEFEKGPEKSDEVVNVTIPEGRNMRQAAERVASVIIKDKDAILDVWTSDSFVDDVINKYDFVTEDVKDEEISYALEGYFFPDTYELLNIHVSPSYVAIRFLDKMERIYERYEAEITAHEFSFHEILTLASLVEHEAILDEDRPKVASVFFNRLDVNMRLESCATLGYALGEWKVHYSSRDQEVDHPYNTYKYFGLPPGPGNMPGEKSIQAVLEPAETDYKFFRANVCDPDDQKTYFSRTLDEHRAKGREFNFDCY